MVIEELGMRQAELGLPQHGDTETNPRKVVAEALRYLRNYLRTNVHPISYLVV